MKTQIQNVQHTIDNQTCMNTPIYTISTKSIDLVARIAEKLGEIRGAGEYSRNLRLRKINRLRSIQSSLEELPTREITDKITDKLGKKNQE